MDLKVDTSVFHMASFLDTNYAKRDYMFSNDWTVDWTHFCIGKWTFLWTRCVHSYMDHRMDTQCFPFFWTENGHKYITVSSKPFGHKFLKEIQLLWNLIYRVPLKD